MTYYEQKHTIPAIETDITEHWRLSSAFVQMQEIAGAHAAALGIGRRDLLQHNIVWVLTKVHIDLPVYPAFGERMLIKTWYAPPGRLVFDRFFEFCREDGTILGVASTAWVFMDVKSRRVVRPSAAPVTLPDALPPATHIPAPQKIRFEVETTLHTRRAVLYSDIDVNGHLNNTRYIDWICDIFPADQFKRERITRLDVSYAHEAKAGEELFIFLRRDGDNFYIAGQREDETPVFESAGAFAHI